MERFEESLAESLRDSFVKFFVRFGESFEEGFFESFEKSFVESFEESFEKVFFEQLMDECLDTTLLAGGKQDYHTPEAGKYLTTPQEHKFSWPFLSVIYIDYSLIGFPRSNQWVKNVATPPAQKE